MNCWFELHCTCKPYESRCQFQVAMVSSWWHAWSLIYWFVTAYACGFARLRAPAKHWRNAFTAEVGTALLSKSLHPPKTIPLQYLLNSQILRLARCPFLVASAKVKTSIFWVPQSGSGLDSFAFSSTSASMDLMDLMDLMDSENRWENPWM